MLFRNQIGPRLLVSVRSDREALSAIDGGADILDVKEPNHGSLGMADLDVIEAVAARTGLEKADVPLSVALGEMVDWSNDIDVPKLPLEVIYAKLGLSEALTHRNWQLEWKGLRNRFDSARGTPLRWVAVGYIDAEIAKSPPISEVLAAAIHTECAGLLIDTYSKWGLGLPDFASPEELSLLADRCHSAGLFLALAGSLTASCLHQISDVPADVIAIRSAACRNANRCAEIDSSSVKAFRATVLKAFDRGFRWGG